MVRTLNEHDLSNDWRKKLETNKGTYYLYFKKALDLFSICLVIKKVEGEGEDL